MIEAVIASVVSAIMLASGMVLARRSKRAATVACFVGLLVVLPKAILSKRPDLESAAIPWRDYALIEPYWPYAVGYFLIGLGLWMARRSLPRRCVMYAGVVALTVPLGLCVCGAASVEPHRMTGVPDAEGVCMQSTTYT